MFQSTNPCELVNISKVNILQSITVYLSIDNNNSFISEVLHIQIQSMVGKIFLNFHLR